MRHAILALLADSPAHGYDLKGRLEGEFGAAWPSVNIGQVYSTLGRLERDGLVSCQAVQQESRPEKKVYALTPRGAEVLRRWFEASPEAPRITGDIFLRLLLAGLGGVDALADRRAMVERQRTAWLQLLRDVNAKALSAPPGEPGTLLLEGAVLHLQADLKWLELYESQLAREATP